ncbi:phosphatidic acid phosphatase type 2/haloperoxidase [Fennellomyces sp. T-0311]|nr:phosphatidic acid phosphatase type 2/haloperoxidase [Fennellomyces sp. T-0311]
MATGPLVRILAKTSEIVITICLLILCYFRSLHLMFMFAGSILCAGVAKGLKQVLRQPRPGATSDPSIMKRESYGMPSSHSQVMAFFAEYTFLSQWRKTAFGITVYIFTIFVLWSRVKMRHHTLAQVSVGAMIGAGMAYLWYGLWQKVEFQYTQMIGYTK